MLRMVVVSVWIVLPFYRFDRFGGRAKVRRQPHLDLGVELHDPLPQRELRGLQVLGAGGLHWHGLRRQTDTGRRLMITT